MKKYAISLALCMCAYPMLAQSAGDPFTSGTKTIYAGIKNNILKSAEEMPEGNYSYKPTPEVRSFGQLIGHVADGQYEFCGPVVADGMKPPQVEKTKSSKSDLIKALNDAFAYCDKAFDGMTDTKGAEMVNFFGNRPMAKLTILQFNNVHSNEHYGNIVTYLRLKSLVPPSSQKR